MKSFSEFLTEQVSLTGRLVHSGMLEGYVRLFYKTLSKTSKGFKKEDPEVFTINGCGEVYDPATKTKVVDKRPFFTLTSQIITNRGRVHYILDMDVDSSNVVSMYRDYGDRSKVDKYEVILTAKKNIVEALKNAGFSVRSDRRSLYVSITDYVKNPTEENGLVVYNYHQRELLKVAKKLFAYDGVEQAYNMYAVTLKQAKVLADIYDGGDDEVILGGNSFAKVVISTNGKIMFYRYEGDAEPESVLYGCFEPINKEYDIED